MKDVVVNVFGSLMAIAVSENLSDRKLIFTAKFKMLMVRAQLGEIVIFTVVFMVSNPNDEEVAVFHDLLRRHKERLQQTFVHHLRRGPWALEPDNPILVFVAIKCLFL